MSVLLDWLTGPIAESLCLALVHSLWQGGAWCALLLVAFRAIRSDRPEVRYAVALTCLYGLLGGACLTWSILRHPTPGSVQPPIASMDLTGASDTGGAAPVVGTVSQDQAATAFPTNRPTTPSSLEIARFSPWIVFLWLVGTCVCLLMSTRHVAAVRRLQAGKPVDDADANQMLTKLVAMLGISRTVRLLRVEGLTVPGVVGILRPAILVPSSLVTGLTPDQWEAILAHELAHIRRWDYVVNLSQLVIESVLFFNPAVWWLSRQVRLEREACCDAVAVGVTARPFQYATLLVSLAKGLQPESEEAALPALGFSREQPGSLLERVRRIVTPGNRSELIMNRPAAVSFLVLGLTAVALLQMGTDVAVAVATSILSEEERMTALVATARKAGVLSPHEKVTIRGTVMQEGGGPLRAPVVIAAATHLAGKIQFAPHVTIAPADSMEFEVTAGPGITYLAFIHPDFAETFAGPFGDGDEPVVTGVTVVLKPGIDVPVTIVGKDGLPVPEAHLTCVPVQRGVGPRFRQVPNTDENGQTVLKHINPEVEYTVNAQAQGFQPLDYHTIKGTDRSLRLEMLGAESASGTVVNERGEPVANALVRPYRSRRAGQARIPLCLPRSSPVSQPVAMSVSPPKGTDAEGRFVLRELADFTTYDVLVEADGYGPMMIVDVHAGDRNLHGVLRSPLTVKGTIRGPTERLRELNGQRKVNWDLLFPCESVSPFHRLNICGSVECNVIDSVGHFTLPPMGHGELTVRAGDDLVRRELTASIGNLELVLSEEVPPSPPAPSPKRPIRITFARSGERVSPHGQLEIYSKSPQGQRVAQAVPIQGGVVEAEVTTPNQLHFGLGEMIGYCRETRMDPTEIGAGKRPLDIVIPVQAAGAMRGRVIDADGTPVFKAQIHIRGSAGGEGGVRTDEKGEFFVPGIPFGAECSFYVMEDRYIAIGPEFTLSAEEPLPFFKIQFREAVDVLLRLVDPSGSPIAGQAVELNCVYPRARQRLKSDDLTNRHGECIFRRLNPELAGYYAVTLDFTRDYIPSTFPLNLGDETVVCRVERGCVIEGTLLHPNDKPVVGARLSAQLSNGKPSDGTHRSFSAEAETDSLGRFRFSNLPPARMRLRGSVPLPPNTFITPAPAGAAEPVTLRTWR